MSSQSESGYQVDSTTNFDLNVVNKQLDKIVRLMQICGIYVHNAATRRLRFVYMVYPIVSLLYQGFVLISKGTKMSFTGDFGTDMFYNLLIFIFRMYLFAVFCIPTFTLGILKTFRKELQLIWMAKSAIYRRKFARKLSLLTNISIGIVTLTCLATVGNLLPTCISLHPSKMDFVIPLRSENWSPELQISVCIVCGLVETFMVTGIWLCTFLYIILWYIVKSEFDNLNEEVCHYIETQNLTFEICIGNREEIQRDHVIEQPRFDLEDLRLLHDVICHMIDLANGLFKFVIFATCGVALLVICITLYYFAKVDESVDSSSMLAIALQLVACIFTLVVIVITGIMMNDKVR